jgi:hypothetical protein
LQLSNVTDNPYQALPDHCFWRRTIAGVDLADVDPVVRGKFQIGREDRIATAGSCFAQHIARHLEQNGLNYFVTEAAHPLVAHLAGEYNYGVFTARYGNIYTSRQLIQTLKRAYGLFEPADRAWPGEAGRAIDPYRPRIQPNGFASLDELVEDRRQHFAAIRRAIEQLDVLVFTLGLTETWCHRADGAAYPLCPGVAGGRFDPNNHVFVNLSVSEVISDLEETVAFVLERNPTARFILTVSPVPLVATMEDRSVLVSTTYSKSVLRVAAEEIAARHEQVAYFPAYEIVTGTFTGGRYFADGLRDVTEAGVSHVMRLFMRHYVAATEAAPAAAVHPVQDQDTAADEQLRKLEEIAAVLCDEVSLDVEPVVAPEPALVGAGQDDRAIVAEASAWSYLRNPKTEPAATEAPGTVVRRSLWRSMLPGLRRK